ncbi:ribonuclease H-like domain-containing protein [Pavlovales sp. CCMP2436]|nr:ribonuclease H-like domain-containing protein [Pavlovales sp. CCMP2436]
MQKTSLIQLASANRCVLIRLCKTKGLPPSLAELLGDTNVLKVGVGIKADMEKLTKEFPIDAEHNGGSTLVVRQVRDLQDMLKKGASNLPGLQGLAASYLGARVNKGQQTSNWARDTLSVSQMRYATTDAWVSRQIYASVVRTHGLDGNIHFSFFPHG